MAIRVKKHAFEPSVEKQAFCASVSGAGGVVDFTGFVRNDGGALIALEIEHYPSMTEMALREIELEARCEWDLIDTLIIHRYGRLLPDAPIVLVCAASAHRRDAFEAVAFMMDYLKSRAPFWKKEIRLDGHSWIAASEADMVAFSRWNKSGH